MKGIVYNILENLIVEKFGDEVMEEIYDETEFTSDVPPFVGPETYPSSDLLLVVASLSQKTNLPVGDLVYEFGKYMFPVLAGKYPVFLEDMDTPLEFLKSVHEIIHIEVKKLFEDANPPTVMIEELTSNRAKVYYRSERKLCRLLEGLLEGVADHFDQNVSYSHQKCMHDGNPECILEIEFSS